MASNETPIAAWRVRASLTQRAAAEALGMSLPAYQQYERGAAFADGSPRIAPRWLLLACAAIEHGIDPIK